MGKGAVNHLLFVRGPCRTLFSAFAEGGDIRIEITAVLLFRRQSCGYDRRMKPLHLIHWGRLRRFCLLLALILFGSPVAAQFAVCNQSFYVVNIAIGREIQGDFQTEGWWTIGPNQCANVVKDELKSRYIYIYAQDVFGQPILRGTTQMCISSRKFLLRGITECWSRGNVAAGFIEVYTQETPRWTLFLSGAP